MSLNSRRSFLKGAALGGVFGVPRLSAAMQETTSPYRRPKLKITDVKTVYLQGFHVRIYTDQGLTGDGEAVDAISGAGGIVAGFRFFLLNQSPLNVEAIWERIRTGRVYIDSGTDSRDDPQAKTFIAQIVENGWTMAKIDVDDARDPSRFDRVNWTANNAEMDHMIDKVAFMRESLPKKIELAVDMHGRYDLPTAKRFAKEVEPFKLVWLEEPVPPENIDAMRDVRQSTHTPICCGENIYLRWGFRELFEKQAVDIIMPDVQKCGGLAESKKIADLAHTYYIPIAPHCQASPIGMMAACHAMATVPNFLVQEWHWGHPPERTARWKQYVKEGDIIQNGYITVPDRPGIGLTINDEAIKKMVRPGSTWFTA
jgi:galactonate dehydratase